jgi:integrase/recombinase XerC
LYKKSPTENTSSLQIEIATRGNRNVVITFTIKKTRFGNETGFLVPNCIKNVLYFLVTNTIFGFIKLAIDMLAQHIHHFIQYLTYEKQFSQHTITAYKNDLEQFAEYAQSQFEIITIVQINHQIVRSWLVEMMNNQITARTVKRKVSSLKTFYKFLLKEGVVNSSPLNKLQATKQEKRLPVFVDEKPMQQLLDEQKDKEGKPIVFDETYEGQRNKLILLLFYCTGIRLSELIGLKESDVDLYNQTIKVLGKRNKERIIPITRELGFKISEFIKLKQSKGILGENLLLTTKGQQLYPTLVYNLVKQNLSKVTSIEKKSPHVLRHTYATHLLNKGADLNAIKELLGHASLAATQVYTHNSIERLKQIYKKKHPRA